MEGGIKEEEAEGMEEDEDELEHLIVFDSTTLYTGTLRTCAFFSHSSQRFSKT